MVRSQEKLRILKHGGAMQVEEDDTWMEKTRQVDIEYMEEEEKEVRRRKRSGEDGGVGC